MSNDIESVLLARTASSDVFGKLDAELQAIRIDSETLVRLHRESHDVGVSVSELVRAVLRARVWGVDHVETVNADRMRRVIGNAGSLPGAGAAS